MKTNQIIRNIIIFFAMLFGGKVSKRKAGVLILMSLTQDDFSRHGKVVMKFPGDHPNNIIHAQGICDAMRASAWMANIPDITATLDAFEQDIIKYGDDESLAQLRLPGAVAARDAFAVLFITEKSENLRLIVQGACDKNKLNALEIAQSCNMDLQAPGGRGAYEWTAKKGELDGSVELTGSLKGHKNKRYCMQWQMTKNTSDTTSWYKMENEILPTLQATTTVTGLTLKDTVYFRYRIILKDGVTEWSDTISRIIT